MTNFPEMLDKLTDKLIDSKTGAVVGSPMTCLMLFFHFVVGSFFYAAGSVRKYSADVTRATGIRLLFNAVLMALLLLYRFTLRRRPYYSQRDTTRLSAGYLFVAFLSHVSLLSLKLEVIPGWTPPFPEMSVALLFCVSTYPSAQILKDYFDLQTHPNPKPRSNYVSPDFVFLCYYILVLLCSLFVMMHLFDE